MKRRVTSSTIGEVAERHGLVVTDDPDFDHNKETFEKSLIAFVEEISALMSISASAPKQLETKWTPGPWHLKDGNATGFKTRSGQPAVYAPARDSDDYFILKIAELDSNVPEHEVAANAALIAAAPHMFGTLDASAADVTEMTNWSDEQIRGWAYAVAQNAKAAIAKARGDV